MMLPDGGPRVGAVAASGRGDGEEDKTAVFHPPNFPFHQPQLRWIHLVVGRVDRQQRGDNFFQVRLRVVGARSVKLVNHVVGIHPAHVISYKLVKKGVGFGQGGSQCLPVKRAADHEEESINGRFQPRWLFLIISPQPRWILANPVYNHPSRHPVTAGDLHRRAGKWQQRIHKGRI